MPERILITGARAPAALDLARSFAAAGFETHMADCTPVRMAQWSRSVSAVHRYPSPRSDPTGFAEAVARLGRQLQPLLIIPTCEEVFHLAMRSAGPALFAPPAALLRRLHSKAMFVEDCLALGLSAPATTRITSKAELAPFRHGSNAFVFKPEYSRFGAHALVGPEASALEALTPTPAAPWVVQRRINGTEVSFYATSVDAQLTAFSAYRSPWRFKGGAGYAFDPLEPGLSDAICDIARALAERHVPKGQFACDVIVDEAGVPWVIECNPRATSGVHMFDRSPDLALALLGRRQAPLLGGADQHQVGPALWSYGLPHALRANRLSEWQTRRREGKDVISAPNDRLPVLGALADAAAFLAKAAARGKRLTETMTDDIEWNGKDL